MRKNLFLVGLTVSVSTAGLCLLVACSSSDSSTFSNTTPDADAEPPPPGFTDGGLDGAGDGGPPQCDPNIPEGFKATWTPPAARPVPAACSAQELKDYYTACLANPSDKGACSTYAAAHATCAACVEPTNGSGPVQWRDVAGNPRYYFTINVAGCLALESGQNAEGQCPANYNAAVVCQRQACENCLATGGQFAQFSACESAAKQTGECKSLDAVEGNSCQGIKDPDAATSACFQKSGEGADTFFPRLMGVYCGG